MLVPTLLAISVLVFGLMRFLPGDVVSLIAGAQDSMTPEQKAEVRHLLGLDRPAYLEYLRWIGGVVRGDLGHSLWTNESVAQFIVSKLPITVELTALSIALSLVIAFPIGVFSALRANTLADTVLRTVAVLGISLPNFWFAVLLLLLVSKGFGWLPPLDPVALLEDPIANLKQMALPALTLGWTLSASTMRMIRATMLETLRQDYLTTARGKGLDDRVVIIRHALPNALIPVVTVIGLQLGGLIGGAVVIEQVFGLPGVGWLLVNAIATRDYPVVQGTVLFLATAFVLVTLVVDITYAYLDPRIRYGT
jgi:peptide/nickel transport system permease protein